MLRTFLPAAVAAISVTAIAVYITVNPSQATVPDPNATVVHGATAFATIDASALPPGLSGTLTYRTEDELVRVRFPDATMVSRESHDGGRNDITSADGLWRAHDRCETTADDVQTCEIVLYGPDGFTRRLDLDGTLAWSRDLQWSPTGHTLAMRTSYPGGAGLFVIDDPLGGQRRVVMSADAFPAGAGPIVTSYAWMTDGRMLASVTGGAAGATGHQMVEIGSEGTPRTVADLAEPAGYLYPSPDNTRFAFTQTGADGWRLMLYDADADAIVDLGAMGSDDPDGAPVPAVPDVKAPMYIAWSPDGRYIAFGGGFEPPYSMTIVDVTSGASQRIGFAEGYPGEIKWTADSSQIAVSTYDPERTRHEVYVVDPATGDAQRVISGCIIVWSPDGRFIALHKEREHGIVIVHVETGAEGFITREHADAVAWEP